MSVTRDVTRDVHRDVTPKMAVTFAVSHDYPSRPVPSRPTSSSCVSLIEVQDLHLHRYLSDAPRATAGAGI